MPLAVLLLHLLLLQPAAGQACLLCLLRKDLHAVLARCGWRWGLVRRCQAGRACAAQYGKKPGQRGRIRVLL